MITSGIGQWNKAQFGKMIDQGISFLINQINASAIPIDIVSFSSSNDFYEQVLSILSFLRYVGTPQKWILYSDGSHTASQVKILNSSFKFLTVEINTWDNALKLPDNCKKSLLPYGEYLLDYAKKLPLGKRLYYYLNYEVERSTLFIDSDILFYDKSSVFEMILCEKVDGWYLPDAGWGCLDSRYKEQQAEQLYQINGGFFLLNKELSDLEEGLSFLKNLNFKYEYFSDQTVFHILFKCNEFMPLDPRIFILDSGDQFDFSYLYPREKMAIRHYTGPVRHKMWQRDWRWHLELK